VTTLAMIEDDEGRVIYSAMIPDLVLGPGKSCGVVGRQLLRSAGSGEGIFHIRD
jgi:hypothetical protein